MADVFISYKREEREDVVRIADALRALKLDVWFDARLTSGESFNQEIDREARSAGCILVCWSPGAIASDWVQAESLIGFNDRKLAACQVAGDHALQVPAPFNSIHANDLRGWDGAGDHAGWQAVLQRIGEKLDRPGLAEYARAMAVKDVKRRISALEKFAQRFSTSPLAENAWSEVEKLEHDVTQSRIAARKAEAANGAAEKEARRKPVELEPQQETLDRDAEQARAWAAMGENASPAQLREFVRNWQTGPFVDLARERLARLDDDVSKKGRAGAIMVPLIALMALAGLGLGTVLIDPFNWFGRPVIPAEDPAVRAETIRRLQSALKALGHSDSTVDGAADPGTAKAAVAFARQAGEAAPDFSSASIAELDAFALAAEKAAQDFAIAEKAAWTVAQRADTVAVLEGFLEDYPSGAYAAEAGTRLATLKDIVAREERAKREVAARQADEDAWSKAQRTDTLAAYQAYLASYRAGAHAATAQTKITELSKPKDNYPVGKPFTDCTGCPKMVVLPAVRFMMGAKNYSKVERPFHEVTIGYKFAVSKFEITWDQWEACVSAFVCSNSGPESRGGDDGWGKGSRPVINVDWNDAQTYARWLSDKTGHTYRLLSEAEWEYAARAGTTTHYSWGDRTPTCSFKLYFVVFPPPNWANFNQCSSNRTKPVGSFPANAFGLHDMHGNVWEWTQDCWNGSYSGAPINGGAWESGDCSRRVLRGGSWRSNFQNLRSASRGRYDTGGRDNDIGFRLARVLEE